MHIVPGDNLSKDDIETIAGRAGKAMQAAMTAAGVPPDLNLTRVFELIFQAMLVATDAAPLHGDEGSTTQESVS